MIDYSVLDLLGSPAHKESESNVKGESSMKNMISATILTVSGLSCLIAVYSVLNSFGFHILGENTLKDKKAELKTPLQRVQKYCFNSLPVLNDTETCDLWLAKYVDVSMSVEIEKPKEGVSEEDKERVKEFAKTNEVPY